MPRQFGKTDRSASWACECIHKHEPGTPCPPVGVWLGSRLPVAVNGLIWIKRRMPDGHWPLNDRLPRDDSYDWWVRAHCGHDGGSRQWAFYREQDADALEQAFRDNPCFFTRCVERIMIENNHGRPT